MSEFKLTILGRGSALPTKSSNQSSQILEAYDKLMMIDCGEGTQMMVRRMDLHISRLNNIFISHLHGDHCFGLIGLLSSLGMMGRRNTMTLHCHPELEPFLKSQIDFFGGDLGYPLVFNTFSPFKQAVIYEDKKITVTAFPLKHSIPASGFLFEEKQAPAHLIKEKADFYNVPLSKYAEIKDGADFVSENGFVIPNRQLTIPSEKPVRYAYCSDTAYNEKMIPIIEGVDCLYHEATFLHEHLARAKQTQHSTAAQAGDIATKAHVKQMIIGHFSARYTDYNPILEEAKAHFEHTIMAEERKTYTISSK